MTLPDDQPLPVGRLRKHPLDAIVHKAAELIASRNGAPLAVTVDPEHRVCVEPIETAAEADLLATYRLDAGRLTLLREIHRDLKAELLKRFPPPMELPRPKRHPWKGERPGTGAGPRATEQAAVPFHANPINRISYRR